MKCLCPVCNTEHSQRVVKCELCEFADELGISRIWPVDDDAETWLNTIVKPYRIEWHRKIKVMQASLDALKKENENLLKELKKTQFSLAEEKLETLETSKITKSVSQSKLPPYHNMVKIPGGTFLMGSPESESKRIYNEGPQHKVKITPFYMGIYPVTQAEYEKIMRKNPSEFKGQDLPVEMVSWYDAVEYCNKLSLKESLTPAYTISGENVSWNRNATGYRLPTEAEWEYACRAGTTTPFNTGNNITTEQANYDGNFPYNNNAKGKYRKETSSVGSFSPNSWGLYDMHGNVKEWCWDWYGFYDKRTQIDPVGASLGANRALRGGSWFSNARFLRSASRDGSNPSYRHSRIGFRLARA